MNLMIPVIGDHVDQCPPSVYGTVGASGLGEKPAVHGETESPSPDEHSWEQALHSRHVYIVLSSKIWGIS